MAKSNSRYLLEFIRDLAFENNKMAFISGPRQVGKTTLSKQLTQFFTSSLYKNWDDIQFRKLWASQRNSILDQQSPQDRLIIFDELHKLKSWKRDLKGLYDLKNQHDQFVVTGSAKLSIFKKGSDSLMGRYFSFRLHPFSYGELFNQHGPSTPQEFYRKVISPIQDSKVGGQEIIERLLNFGGFPEPYLKNNRNFHRLWLRGRVEKIVREDLRDLSRIQELSQIELLVSMLPERVGSLFSNVSIREDLEVAPLTLKRWLEYLKELYYFYEIKPFSKSIPRSLKKEGKIYLWDWSEIENSGAKLENLVASHLYKACHFWNDTGEGHFDLYYLRNKEKHEVDFLLTDNGRPWISFEVKSGQTQFQKTILHFSKFTKHKLHIQICHAKNHFQVFNVGDLKVVVASLDHILHHLP